MKNKVTVSTKENDTLINVLLKYFDGAKLKTIKNYLSHGNIFVNGKCEKKGSRIIIPGDKVIIQFSKDSNVDMPLKIIYEDNDLIVIDKPAGLLSISNRKEKQHTAYRMVSDYIKKKNPQKKLFVVHRLDEETSGILMFSTNEKLRVSMQDNWNDIVKVREYIALVEGNIKKGGTIKSYLTENHSQMVYSTKNKNIGKLAITNYEVIKSNDDYTLLRVLIDTGRRNQIRVHMSEMNHPIVGDKKYGCHDNSIKRLGLHASKLELIDPRTGNILKFKSNCPKIIESKF